MLGHRHRVGLKDRKYRAATFVDPHVVIRVDGVADPNVSFVTSWYVRGILKSGRPFANLCLLAIAQEARCDRDGNTSTFGEGNSTAAGS